MACTCGGTAPGYPQHEPGCGLPEETTGYEDRFWEQHYAAQETPPEDDGPPCVMCGLTGHPMNEHF